jgi:hypothetical protein
MDTTKIVFRFQNATTTFMRNGWEDLLFININRPSSATSWDRTYPARNRRPQIIAQSRRNFGRARALPDANCLSSPAAMMAWYTAAVIVIN